MVEEGLSKGEVGFRADLRRRRGDSCCYLRKELEHGLQDGLAGRLEGCKQLGVAGAPQTRGTFGEQEGIGQGRSRRASGCFNN